jgi:hypothetical protein
MTSATGKIKERHNPLRRFAAAFLSILILTAVLTGCTTRELKGRITGWNIQNPYAHVDWTKYHRHKANFHTHTFVHAPNGYYGPPPPGIKSIAVDPRSGTLHIEAVNHERLDWISKGKIVHTGDRVNLSDLQGLGGYIRAEIHAAEGGPIVGTQPFRIRPSATYGGP